MIICGTGHRPNKLGGYGTDATTKVRQVARFHLSDHDRPKLIISGGALGWDQALADEARRLDIPFMLALPFEDFDCKWPKESRGHLAELMYYATEVFYVCVPGYAPWKMQARNKWMVDNADIVLALWNGTSGGTANCIKYAESVKKDIVNLWEDYERICDGK